MAYDSFTLQAANNTKVKQENVSDPANVFVSLVDQPAKGKTQRVQSTVPPKTQIHQKINTYVPADKMDEDFSTYGQAMRSYFVKVNNPYSR